MTYRRSAARGGSNQGGRGQGGSGQGGRLCGFRAASLVAAVAAGCSVATLAAGPSWALRRPEPRPAVDTAAPAASRSDLEVVRLDPDAAPPGGTTTIHAFIANRGPDTTAAPFTVLVTLPPGVTPEGPYYPEDCEVRLNGRQVRCVFPAGLPPLRSATALVPVRLSPDLPIGRLTGGSVAVRDVDDPDEGNNRQPFDITVVETAPGS
ncbi:hypothetical protein ACFV84_06165 [Kitasatospora sp. NPDC059811]|uniref:hypothetical protein n=1 Tax=Streptomycetaceae TaxID=2062 RepID=UPI000B19D969|nr:hypothetical protein [Streptomyces sp. MJM8645]